MNSSSYPWCQAMQGGPELKVASGVTETGTRCSAGAASGIAELTERLKRADEQAWRAFHSTYAHRLYRYLLVVLHGNETAASEALQSTFIRAAKYMRPFADESIFWSWLTVLARTAAFDESRKRTRLAAFLDRFSKESRSATAPPPNPDGTLLASLEAGLEKLKPGERTLLLQKYVEGISLRHLAEDLSLTEKAVESRLTRARRRLRALVLAELKVAESH